MILMLVKLLFHMICIDIDNYDAETVRKLHMNQSRDLLVIKLRQFTQEELSTQKNLK